VVTNLSPGWKCQAFSSKESVLGALFDHRRNSLLGEATMTTIVTILSVFTLVTCAMRGIDRVMTRRLTATHQRHV
jgi:hypothetical protein